MYDTASSSTLHLFDKNLKDLLGRFTFVPMVVVSWSMVFAHVSVFAAMLAIVPVVWAIVMVTWMIRSVEVSLLHGVEFSQLFLGQDRLEGSSLFFTNGFHLVSALIPFGSTQRVELNSLLGVDFGNLLFLFVGQVQFFSQAVHTELNHFLWVLMSVVSFVAMATFVPIFAPTFFFVVFLTARLITVFLATLLFGIGLHVLL